MMTKQPAKQQTASRTDERVVQVAVHLSSGSVAVIDAWRRDRPERPGRSEVIRQIVEAAIAANPNDVLPGPDELARVLR